MQDLTRTAKQSDLTIRVLLIIGETLLREGLSSLIQSRTNWNLIMASESCRPALDHIGSEPPDVILLDWPVDGLLDAPESNQAFEADLTDLLRLFPHAHILLLCRDSGIKLSKRALAIGASGIIARSESFARMHRAVEGVQSQGIWLGPTLECACNQIAHYTSTAAKQPHSISLTSKQLKIIHLVCAGLSNQAIANRLYLAEPTVRYHLHQIFRMIGVQSRTQLIHYAILSGLLNSLI